MKESKQVVPKYQKYRMPDVVKRRLKEYEQAEPGELSGYGVFAGLKGGQITVAVEMASDMMSGTIRADKQLAIDLGINPSTIYEYRNNPVFNHALGVLAAGIVRGRVMKYVALIEKHAETNWQAAKFLMEWVGLFVPKTQHLNLNVSTTQSQAVFETSEEAIYAFIKKVKAMGWSLERIAEIYNAD